MTFQLKVVFAKSSCLLCSIYETIKELAHREITAAYENNFFFPVFVTVTQYAPAKHF